MLGEPSRLDPLDHLGERCRRRLPHLVAELVPDPSVVPLGEHGVLAADRRGGRPGLLPEPGERGRRVGRELEDRSGERRVGRLDLLELVGAAGLVVGDDERAVGTPIESVDGALQSDAPSVGQRHGHVLDALAQPVRETVLGGEDGDPSGSAVLAVLLEPAEQVVTHRLALDGPRGRSPRPAGAFEVGAHPVEVGEQCRAVLVGPARRGRLGQAAVDHVPVEEVERLVVDEATVECPDGHLGVGLLDGLHPQDVADEVAVWAGTPRLDAGRRDRPLDRRRDVGPAEVTVERRQGRAEARRAHREAGPHRRIQVGEVGHRLGAPLTASTEEVAEASLTVGRSEHDVAEALRGRLDHLDPLAHARRGDVEVPGRLVGRGRAEVAPWEGDDRVGSGDERQVLVVEADRSFVGSGETRPFAVGVTEERIGAGRRREQALRGAHDDGDVDVESGGGRQRPDRDTRSDAALTDSAVGELALEHRPEPLPGRRLPDEVERTETLERRHQRLPSPVLRVAETPDRAATEPGVQTFDAPVHPVPPRPGRQGMTEIRAQRRHEVGEFSGGGTPSLVVVQGAETWTPVLVVTDAGGATDPFPGGGVPRAAVGVTPRDVGEQREQRPPPQAAPVDVEQVQQQAGSETFRQLRAAPTVPRDAGGVEVVFDETGVGALRRPEHGDAFERDGRPGRGAPCGVDDGAHGDDHLVVGVGRRHDARRSGLRGTRGIVVGG